MMYGRSPRGQSAGLDPASPSDHEPIMMAPGMANRPSRAPPDPWGGQHVAYVGQDPLCGNSGGCSQQGSSARSSVTSSMGMGSTASYFLGSSSQNAARVGDDGGRGGRKGDHAGGAVDVPVVGASPQETTAFNEYCAATFPSSAWPLPSISDMSQRHEINQPGDFRLQGSRGTFTGEGGFAHTSPPPLLYSPPRYLAPIPRPSSAGSASEFSTVGVNMDTRKSRGVGPSAFSLSPDIIHNMAAEGEGGVGAGARGTEILGATRLVWPLARTAVGDRWSYDELYGGAQGSQNDSGNVPGTLGRSCFGIGVGNDSAAGSGAGISQRNHIDEPVVGDVRVQRCQVHGCPQLSPYSVDARPLAIPCGAHCAASSLRVMDSICGVEGCGLPTEIHEISASGKIERLCSRHRRCLGVSDAYKACCEFSGCTGNARYGPKEGPLTFCQHHKRTGMFTIRNGKLLVATRDGRAFRLGGASSVGSGEDEGVNKNGSGGGSGLDGHRDRGVSVGRGRGRGGSNTRRRSTPSPALHNLSRGVPSAGTNGSAIDDGMIMIVGEGGTLTRPGNGGGSRIVRKLCEIPGCPVQPSYGPQGTKRPRFCTGHKGPGMIALKNRPCLYPGCDTRPHYGISGGRAVYCAQHMKPGMVHLLKEQLTKEKENQSRKRTAARNLKAEQRAKAREEAKIAAQTASKATRQSIAHGDERKERDGEDKQKKGQGQEDIDDGRKGREETDADNEQQEQQSESDEDDEGKQQPRNKPKRPRITTRTAGRTAAAAARGKRTKPKGKAKSVAWGKTEGKTHQRANATADNEDNDDDDHDDGDTALNLKRSSYERQASSPPVVSAGGRGRGRGRRSEVASPTSSAASPTERLAAVSPAAPPSSASSRPSSAASGDNEARTGTKSKTGRGMGFAFGGAPSTEMRLLQKARESARAEAAAAAAGGGSSRRARAPSLKALEAAGMVEEGAQWMNKEMKEGHARQIRESKEKRKAAAEAGLKIGVVLEELTVDSGSAASGTVGGGDAGVGSRDDVVCGDGSGIDGRVGSVEGGGAESGAAATEAAGGLSKHNATRGTWRKRSVEIRQQAEEERSHSETMKTHHQKQQGQQGQHRATVRGRIESAGNESGVGNADNKIVGSREVKIDACGSSESAAVEMTAPIAAESGTADRNAVEVKAGTAAAGNNDVKTPSAENEGEGCESANEGGEERRKSREDAGERPVAGGMNDDGVAAHFAAVATVPEKLSKRGRNRNNVYNRREQGYNSKHGEEGGSEECKKKPTRSAKKFGDSRGGAFSGRNKDSNKGKAKDTGKGRGRDDGADGVGGRSAALGDVRPVTECDFAACSRSATFGVNGTVRYCKAHRLFGMHEIANGR